MTNTDYRNFISQFRYHYSCLVSNISLANQYGSSTKSCFKEQLMLKAGLYLQVLYDYFLPTKVVGTTSSGGTTVTLRQNIVPAGYSNYLYHTITGNGIPDGTIVTDISSNTLTLSQATTAAYSNSIFTIGKNCVTIEELKCVVDDINNSFGTNFCIDGYYTEFDLTLSTAPTLAEMPLLYGSYATILTGANIYSNLTKSTLFSGDDTVITYNFTLNYPYFAYPAIYPDLLNIYDQEGDDVLASGAFDKYLLDVTIPGETETVQYKVYRTDYITTIPNQSYTFNF